MEKEKVKGFEKVSGYLFIICGIVCLVITAVALAIAFIPSLSVNSGIADATTFVIKIVSLAIIGSFLILIGYYGLKGRYGELVVLLTIVMVLGLAGLLSAILLPRRGSVGQLAYNGQIVSAVPSIILPIAVLIFIGISRGSGKKGTSGKTSKRSSGRSSKK